VKNLEIGYSIPEFLKKRTGITNLRLYANCLNLFTVDNLKILDPESINGNGQYYPQSRVLNAGFNLTF
jgi:hypothetical protein